MAWCSVQKKNIYIYIYIYIYIPNDTEVLDECYRKDVLNAICLHYNWMDMPAPNKKKQQRKG